MRLRACWRLLRALAHGLHGLLIVWLRFGALDKAARHARIGWWSATMFTRLGMSLVVRGTFKPGVKLIVANHVSWLDILAIHAVCPQARFVSKADVRQWPLINRLVDAADTLYIERERRRDAMRVVHQTVDALRAGHTVAVFPEGTTGPGPHLLPMHANLLQAAIAAEAPLQPVVLRFPDARSAFSPSAAYIGDTTLAQSLWLIACGEQLRVEVTVLEAFGTRHADRRALVELLREKLDAVLAESR